MFGKKSDNSPQTAQRQSLLRANMQEMPEPLETRREPDYFVEPRWKRLTEYEKLLVYAQPNPHWIPGGFNWGDYTQKFSGGRDVWGNYFTELKSSNWYSFRDPNRRWQFPYVTEKAEEWRAKQRLLKTYVEDGQYRQIDPWWLNEIINKYYAAFLHHEYGLFAAHASPIRDCLSDVIRVAISTGCFDVLDSAQMIQAERIFWKRCYPELDESVEPSKQLWLEDASLKPVREAVEQLWKGTYDHLEAIFAIYMVHEPLFGRFARREFFTTMAPYFGDVITPMFLSWTIRSQHVDKDWAFDLFDTTLGQDAQFGAYNKKVMQMWLEKWAPQTIVAIQGFGGLWDKLEGRPQTQALGLAEARAQSIQRILTDWQAEFLERLGLSYPWERELESLQERVLVPVR